MPRIETGEVAVYDLPTPYRIKRWLDLAPRIGNDIFIKLYAHGAREDNAGALLGTNTKAGGLALMYKWLHEAAEERQLEVHWASAFDMYSAVKQLTCGQDATSQTNDEIQSGVSAGTREH